MNIDEKLLYQQELAQKIEDYLKKGNKIQQIGRGVQKDSMEQIIMHGTSDANKIKKRGMRGKKGRNAHSKFNRTGL